MKRFVYAAVVLLGGLGLGVNGYAQDARITTSWGNNEYGQVGIGTSGYNLLQPQRTYGYEIFEYLTNAQQVACGGQHTLAVLDDGTVQAWGYGGLGQLGQGIMDTGNKTRPTPVPVVANAARVAAGGNHSIALIDNGTVYAWGQNVSGQLGIGDNKPRYTPQFVTGLSSVSNVYAGTSFTFFLLNNGTVKACGNNALGQLGFPGGGLVDVPTDIPGLTNVALLSGGDSHAAAVLKDGTLWVWGNNQFGQLGLGDGVGSTSSPTRVDSINGARSVACGGFHTLVALNDGTVWSFGQNTLGQLGLGDHTNRSSPTRITDLANVARIAAGRDFSMARLEDRRVWSWGNNYYGQLGTGETIAQTNPSPRRIDRLARMSEISCGNYHAFAQGLETPILRVTPDYRNYGTVQVGDNETKNFTVRNIGFGTLLCVASVASPFRVTSGDRTLWDDEWALVTIVFEPSDPIYYSNTVTFAGGYETQYGYVIGEGWTPGIVLQWEELEGTSYRVLTSTAPEGPYDTVFKTNIPIHYVMWTNFAPEELLFYCVQKENESAEGTPDITRFKYNSTPP